MGKGVVVKTVIYGLVFDGATKDSMQKAVRDALIAFMAATAEAPQAEATREAQRAGIAYARAMDPQSYRGRKPSFDREQLDAIHDMLAQDVRPSAISNRRAYRGRPYIGSGTIRPKRRRSCWNGRHR
jgi:putative DNA-invertase from lambdoid prophage Rac